MLQTVSSAGCDINIIKYPVVLILVVILLKSQLFFILSNLLTQL